jgi:hypothetical protein
MNAEHYRDMAAHFRRLAEVEPLVSLRRHLRRLAQQHDEIAAELERQASPTIAAEVAQLGEHRSPNAFSVIPAGPV